eukprot:gene11185-11335_t
MQLFGFRRSAHSALLQRSQRSQASVRAYNVAPVRVVRTEEISTAVKSDDKEAFVGPDVDVRDNALQPVTVLGVTLVNCNLPSVYFFIVLAAPHMAPALLLAPAPYFSVDEASSAVESIDESLVPVQASKVGVFRRGRYAGGKKVGKGNVADVGAQVKKGQTLGYIEQLGTFVEVKAPEAGEIAAYNAEEGDPVEYQQVLVQIAPFFGVEEAVVTQHRL